MQHPGPQKTCQKCRNKVGARRQMLKRLGICVDCKEAPSVGGKSCCADCLRFNANRKRLKQEDRKSKGLCTQCGKKARGLICGSCRPKVRANQKRELKRRTAEEVCRYCRKAAVVPDRAGCRECLDERADYSRKRLSDDAARKESYRKRDERYAARKAAGLCIFCAKPAAPFVKCEVHRAAGHEHYHIKQIKKKAAAERAALLQASAPQQSAPARPA